MSCSREPCGFGSHAPDYFARLADDSALVLDCRPADRIKPEDQVSFDATRHACAALGWRCEIVDAPAWNASTGTRSGGRVLLLEPYRRPVATVSMSVVVSTHLPSAASG
jgi:hypothetical protein